MNKETRRLVGSEVPEAIDSLKELAVDLPVYGDAVSAFLKAYAEGGDVWMWGVEFQNPPGRYGYSYGYWVVRGDDVVASLCHSYS